MYNFYAYRHTNCLSWKIYCDRDSHKSHGQEGLPGCLWRSSPQKFVFKGSPSSDIPKLQLILLKFSKKLCCCVALGHFCYLFSFDWFRKKLTRWYQETKMIYLVGSTRGCSRILLNPEPTTVNKPFAATAARLPTEMTNETIIGKKKLNVVKDEGNYIETHWTY